MAQVSRSTASHGHSESTRRPGPGEPETPWTPADRDGEPMARLSANFPLWLVAGVLVAGALGAAAAGEPLIVIGFAVAAVLVGVAALLGGGRRVADQLDDQPPARAVGVPLVGLAIVIAIIAVIGAVVAGS